MVAHLALNAEGLAGALTGVVTEQRDVPMYALPGGPGRATSRRSPRPTRARSGTASWPDCTDLDEPIDAVPDDLDWDSASSARPAATGPSRPAAVPGMRLREVEIHHADLRRGLHPRRLAAGLRRPAAGRAAGQHARTRPGRSPRTPSTRTDTWSRGEGGPTGLGHRRGPRLVADRARDRRGADQRRRRRAADRRRGEMTVTTPARCRPAVRPDVRELDHLTITKVAVDEQMSNNCYLLRCNHTGDQVLIDAAAEPDTLLPLVGDAGARLRGHHPPALGPPPGALRRGRRDRRGDRRRGRGRRRDHRADRRPDRPRGQGRRHGRGRRLHARGHLARRPHPRLDRAALRRLRRPRAATRTCSPATRCSPAASATPSATSPPSSSSSTTSRPRSSTGSPTTPGSTPATATTRRSAPSARTAASGASGAGSQASARRPTSSRVASGVSGWNGPPRTSR